MPEYRKTDEAVAALSPEAYHITQQSGTERPGTGKYLNKANVADVGQKRLQPP